MQGLFQSAFFHALGFTIVNCLWQTAIVWLLYLLISHTLTLASTVKYRMAIFAQMVCFVWFWITLIFYENQSVHFNTLNYSDQFSQTNTMGSVIAKQLVDWLLKAEQVFPYISLAYLLLLPVMVIRFMAGYRHTQMIRQSGLVKMPAEWRVFISKLSVQFSLKKEVSIFLSEKITTPLTIGFLKPVILIPIASINHLTTEQLEAVLLHEMAHIKRYDYLVNLLLSLVELSLFFSPFVRLISHQIQKERENSCDDWVLQYQYNAAEYADALLRIAIIQATPAFAMTASGKKNDLLQRIQRMLTPKEQRFHYRKQLLGCGWILLILGSFAWLHASVNNYPETKATITQGVPAHTQYIPAQSFPDPGMIMTTHLFANHTFLLPVLPKPAIPLQINLSNTGKPGRQIVTARMMDKSGFTKRSFILKYQAINKSTHPEIIPAKVISVQNIAYLPQIKSIVLPKVPVLQEKVFPQMIENASGDEQDISLTVNNTYDLLRKMDLEKFIADMLRYGHLNEQGKSMILNQLKKIQLTPKEKDLLIRELKAKQWIRKLTHNGESDTRIHVSLSDSDILVMTPRIELTETDNKRIIQIKLAVLKQLTLLSSKLGPMADLTKNEKEDNGIDQQ